MRKLALLFLVSSIAMNTLNVFSATTPTRTSRSQTGTAKFVPNEVLVQFKSTTTEYDQVDAQRLIGAGKIRRLQTDAMRTSGEGVLELVSITGLTVSEAIEKLQSHPSVEFAEPNWIYTHEATSNDPFYTGGSMWNMYGESTSPANQFGSHAGEVWASGNTGSRQVYVGVIDQGIQFDHPDLSANIWTNVFDPIDGIDNDGNGFIDDSHGWDFVSNDNTIYDGSAGDSVDAHGTHVAGTIGAVGGNGIGVVGVNWNVTLISAKFLGPEGGTTFDAIRAIDYLTDLKTRHNLNIVATNNSYGGGAFSQAFLNAITRAANAQILFIAAAGNGGTDNVGDDNDVTPYFPASYNTTAGAGYDSVISVASITNTGEKSSFSNYGATTVDLGAPGSGVYSTVPFNSYQSFSGTSMATPHVTGAAALYAANNPGSSAASIKTALLNSISATPSLSNNTVTGGRLNISNLLQPTAFAVTANPPSLSPGEVLTVNWTAPSSRSATDWIGLFKVGTPDTAFISWQYTAGTPVGSISFLAPGTAGDYEFRYFINNGFNKVATSNQIIVTSTVTTFTLEASPSTTNAGDTISISWTVPSGRPATDWIGLYKKGDPDTNFVAWKYTAGVPSGTETFTAPNQAGQYDFRYFTNNSFSKAATSNTVTVNVTVNNFTLVANPSAVFAGDPITISWTAPSGRPATDWIGLFRVGTADTSFISWVYTAGGSAGSSTFNAPVLAGPYEFRYFTNDSYVKVATSNTVVVSTSAFSLSASPNLANAGQAVVVTWIVPSGRPTTDWIGLYAIGSPDTNYLSWQYTGGAASGNVSFPAPIHAGQFEFRYFTNNSFNRAASSNSFTVPPG